MDAKLTKDELITLKSLAHVELGRAKENNESPEFCEHLIRLEAKLHNYILLECWRLDSKGVR